MNTSFTFSLQCNQAHISYWPQLCRQQKLHSSILDWLYISMCLVSIFEAFKLPKILQLLGIALHVSPHPPLKFYSNATTLYLCCTPFMLGLQLPMLHSGVSLLIMKQKCHFKGSNNYPGIINSTEHNASIIRVMIWSNRTVSNSNRLFY